jgi:pimeloyl-ACP methyl ester carboxylesterase
MNGMLLRATQVIGSALGRVAPNATVRLAKSIYTTAPRLRPMRDEEKALFGEAEYRTVPFRHHRLRCWTWGSPSAPGILLIHGWGGSPAIFGPLIAKLRASGWRLTAYLGPAHGEPGVRQTTAMTWVHALRKLTEDFGPFRAFVGHSLGAATIVAAARLGAVAERHVLISPVSSLIPHTEAFGAMFGLSKDITAKMRQLIWDEYIDDCSPLGRDWEDVYDTKGATTTLIVHDEGDPLLPLDHARYIAARWPNSHLMITQGLGHFRTARDDVTVEAIARFLQEVQSRPAAEDGRSNFRGTIVSGQIAT